MFNLRTKDGSTVNMKNGSPFTYTTRVLAELGRSVLEADRKAVFQVVKA